MQLLLFLQTHHHRLHCPAMFATAHHRLQHTHTTQLCLRATTYAAPAKWRPAPRASTSRASPLHPPAPAALRASQQLMLHPHQRPPALCLGGAADLLPCCLAEWHSHLNTKVPSKLLLSRRPCHSCVQHQQPQQPEWHHCGQVPLTNLDGERRCFDCCHVL